MTYAEFCHRMSALIETLPPDFLAILPQAIADTERKIEQELKALCQPS